MKISIDDLKFKSQELVDSTSMDVIGYEILSILNHNQKTACFKNATQLLVKHLITTPNSALRKYFSTNKIIFINIERDMFCDYFLVEKLIHLNKKLSMANISLAIEVTERRTCGLCNIIDNTLTKLQNNGIYIAMDDYDIYQGDFREQELNKVRFDFIKIRYPLNSLESTMLKNFTKSRAETIIIEMIESEKNVKEIKSITNGQSILQGYYFDKGTPIEW